MNEKGWVVDAPKMDSGQTSHKWKKAQVHKEDATLCNLCIGSTWNEGPVVQRALQTHREVKQEWLLRSFVSKQTRDRRGGEVRRLLQDRGGQ